MYDFKDPWKARIAGALNAILRESGAAETVEASRIVAEIPPQPELGDLGFPMFTFSRLLRKAPPQIAQAVAAQLAGDAPPALTAGGAPAGGTFTADGPYVNVRLNRGEAAAVILSQIPADESGGPGPAGAGPGGLIPGAAGKTGFGRPGTLDGSRIMVEFSSPNTNKPLHLGHLRNDVLGESVSRIFAACGAEIRKVCIINDRGVHICKSMLAYKEYGQGKTPESEGIKSDHFVGDWYVKFHQMATEGPGAAGKAAPEERAQEMLRKWEAGDSETVALWKQMNKWAVEGMGETYKRTGVSFDQYYYESQTYLLGKDEILKGLDAGLFYRAEDGAVWVDLSEEKLDKKVLLRKDGTSLYITQDIGTAIFRHKDWPFDRLVFVVGSEQQYHFQVLFKVLEKLGFEWARNLYHLSYGMVNLPEGKMKSREGTVVDADDLLDSLKELALREIREKDREEAVGEPGDVAEKIALGALHYYLLQVSPSKDMLFNPRESLSFTGNTGPYLQYMGARISALLRKASMLREDSLRKQENGDPPVRAKIRPELLSGDAEWELLKVLGGYSEAVAAAAARLDPSLLAAYLYELSKAFSRFYHDCPILNAETPDLAAARLGLCRGVLWTLKDALHLICIPFLETM
ncbi:MAG: arginine--tRNA ligase [Treponema sp.]|jgi:arginyl-tRNA synthetase|nr:arginine--tRNA ligase [Treponema sp.]